VNLEFILILIGLLLVAALYSSVGHGGASGYLAILSLASYGLMDDSWLKQQAWCLNIVVASIAFYHYRKAGHHDSKLTLPFIAASVPFALLGGYLVVEGNIYDILLSIALVGAAWRLFAVKSEVSEDSLEPVDLRSSLPVGGMIGLASGVIGVGGGIFLSPVMLLKRWATPKAAAATAALFILANSAASLVGAGLSGQLDVDLSALAPFVAVVLVGGLVGSRYGAEVAPQQLVRKLLVAVLVIAAAKRLLGLIGM
jgi:uncharacterized membrane protein YfcA